MAKQSFMRKITHAAAAETLQTSKETISLAKRLLEEIRETEKEEEFDKRLLSLEKIRKKIKFNAPLFLTIAIFCDRHYDQCVRAKIDAQLSLLPLKSGLEMLQSCFYQAKQHSVKEYVKEKYEELVEKALFSGNGALTSVAGTLWPLQRNDLVSEELRGRILERFLDQVEEEHVKESVLEQKVA